MPSPHLRNLRLRGTAALCWAAIGFVGVVLGAATLPLAFGLHSYTVRSGSMSPAIDTGDMVVSKQISPTDARIGDIVMFKDPGDGQRLTSHRVRAVHRHNGRSYFVTRGDANNAFERWNVPNDGTIGEIEYRIPKLGYAVAAISSTPGKLLLVVLPALALLWLGLLRIWRSEPRAKTEEAG